MIIGVAGPYSATSIEERRRNLDIMHNAAVEVFKKGHIPLVGIDAAIPVVAQMKFETEEERYDAIMRISLTVIDQCDALLVIGESRGVQMEKDLIEKKGLKVFYNLNEF